MKGKLKKLKSDLSKKGEVTYQLPLNDELINLNDLIGKKIKLEFFGDIYCVDTGKKIKKSYNNGYSYESFLKLAECDVCIMQPEKCHYHFGTCREPSWGESHCMKEHVLYLSVTSGVKVGITRRTQVPTRWIDQGAKYAIEIASVPNRYASGLMEVELKSEFADKTNWRTMLKESPEAVNLSKIRDDIWKKFEEKFIEVEAVKSESKQVEIIYPVLERPEKFKSFSFDKEESIERELKGIKGQYLIFDDYVLNIRKHQGYEVSLTH